MGWLYRATNNVRRFPNSLIANLIKDEIELNLDYLIKSQGKDGSWSPTWSWGGGENEEAWKRVEIKWKGYLTVQNLIKLSAFWEVIYSYIVKLTETLVE